MKSQKTKICSICKKKKSVNEFQKDKNRKDELQFICKTCRRIGQLEGKFGIDLDQYFILFNSQNGCCAICKRHQSNFKRALSVDHDHKTELIRGLLCDRCNMLLGIYENPKKELLQYLKEAPLKMTKIYKKWINNE